MNFNDLQVFPLSDSPHAICLPTHLFMGPVPIVQK